MLKCGEFSQLSLGKHTYNIDGNTYPVERTTEGLVFPHPEGGTYTVLLTNHRVTAFWRASELVCPACSHGRRTLHLGHGLWVCRQCLGLRYSSQCLTSQERRINKIAKLREELFDEGKPKGRWQSTHDRKLAELYKLEDVEEELFSTKVFKLFG